MHKFQQMTIFDTYHDHCIVTIMEFAMFIIYTVIMVMNGCILLPEKKIKLTFSFKGTWTRYEIKNFIFLGIKWFIGAF